MKQKELTRNLLLTHYEKYPKLQLQDIFKYLHQSCFGCEHMVSSLENAIDYINQEAKTMQTFDQTLMEPLDGAYSRVHLGYLKHSLSATTLGKLFYESAKSEHKTQINPDEKLQIVKELIQENKLPFLVSEFEKSAQEWKENGYPALHHSEIFKEYYHPSYRVIANQYIPFLPFFAILDSLPKDKKTIIAIEGGSASGKTTLGGILKTLYDCTIFHTDDFFLRPEQRTPQRYAQIGGNIDRERFLESVLLPLKNNESIQYQRFNCSNMELSPPKLILPKNLVIVEGAYSMHPEFENFYDFSVFLDIDSNLQKKRILKRNSPEFATQFFEKWIPMEETYFSKTDIKNRCNLILPITE